MFKVLANSVEEGQEKIQRAKDSLEVYPTLLERISEKAQDMRLNAYMTDEGERLVKQAEEIGQKLSQTNGLAQMFGTGADEGQEVGTNLVNKLSEIDEKLDAIQAREKEIESEKEKIAEQAEILEQEEEKRHQASISLRTQIMQTREEMIKLIAAGKQGTPEFMSLAQKAGDMREQLQRANAFMQYFDDPNRGLTTLKVGLQGVAGAAGLVTSTIGLFNEDSKKMAEIQTKVQSVLGIVVGLETTYNMVKKTGVLMMAIEEVKTWALAKARGVQAAATTAATAAQEGLNVAMTKNPYGAIIALLVTLGAAIWAVTKALTSETDAEKKAREEKEKHIKEIQKQQKDWADSVAASASRQIASYNELQRKWNELGNDMEAKKKFVKDNQNAFHNLGFAVDSVSVAENVLVKNTDAVVNAIMARAKAAAYQELATEELKKQIQRDLASNSIQGGQYRTVFKAGQKLTPEQKSAYRERYGIRTNFGDSEGVLSEHDAKFLNNQSIAYQKRRQEAAKKAKEESDKYINKLKDNQKKEYEAEKKAAEEAGVKLYEGGKNNTKKDNTEEKKREEQKKIAEMMDKQARNQKRLAEDLEFSTRQAEIDAMKEGSAKKIAQIQLNHDKELNAIERSYEDLKIKRIEEAKQLWEADSKNKGKDFYKSNDFQTAKNNVVRKRLDDGDLDAVKREEMDIINQVGKNDLIAKLRDTYGQGNVDVIARPVIDAARLAQAGWKDVGDGIATVFSMQKTVLDAAGNQRQILFTPILPDGNVMTPEEIEGYLKNVIDGAQDFLEADTNKIIIKVGEVGENKDLGGNDLHLGQEELYKGVEDRLKTLYDNATNLEYDNYHKKILASNEKLKQEQDKIFESQVQSMRDYLKEYGTFEEQKLAITQEYEQKIADETDPYKKAGLMAERDQKIEDVQNEEMKQNVDWENIFTDLRGHTKSFLEGLRDQLQGVLSSGDLKVDEMEVVQEKIREINSLILEQGGIFSFIGPLQIEYNRRLQEYADAQARLETAQEEQTKAEVDVNMAKDKARYFLDKNGMEDVAVTSDMKNPFKEGTKEAEEFAKIQAKLINSETKLGDARKNTEKATKDVKNAEDSKNKGSKAIDKWENFQNSKGFQTTMSNLSSAPELLGNLGLGAESEKAQKGLNGLNDAMGAATDFMTGNYIGALSKGISAVTNFGEAFGLWSNSNRAEIEAKNNKLALAMDTNTAAIERLTDEMHRQSPAKAFETYEEIREYLKQNEKSQQRTMENNASMYDGGHSLWYDFKENGGEVIARKIYQYLGKTPWDRSYDIGSMVHDFSAEDWNTLLKERSDLMTELSEKLYDSQDSGNYNGLYQDILKFADDYRTKYDDLLDDLRQQVTGISFDSMYDSFVSSLMDMDKKAEDFTNDFEGYLRNAIYQAMMAENLKPLLQDWYKAFSDAMRTKEKNGKYLSQTEIDSLMKSGGTYQDENGKSVTFEGLEAIRNVGLEWRDAIEELGLYNGKNGRNQQSASANGISNISYDQADAITGILLGHTIIFEQIKAILLGMEVDDAGNIIQQGGVSPETSELTLLNANAELLFAVNSETRDIAADSRDILAGMAIHVEEIRDGMVDTVVPRIKNIDDNLTKVYKIVEAQ